MSSSQPARSTDPAVDEQFAELLVDTIRLSKVDEIERCLGQAERHIHEQIQSTHSSGTFIVV